MNDNEKASNLLKKFEESESSPERSNKDWPEGCKYEKKTEDRIGPNGNSQFRICRRVYGCKDPSYNHDWICSDWQDF